MTEDERLIITNLSGVSLLPGSWDKRFIKTLSKIVQEQSEKELSEQQKVWMYRLVYKYRRQISFTYQKFKKNPECKPFKSKHKSSIE